jgi:Uma2 family endonuclease
MIGKMRPDRLVIGLTHKKERHLHASDPREAGRRSHASPGISAMDYGFIEPRTDGRSLVSQMRARSPVGRFVPDSEPALVSSEGYRRNRAVGMISVAAYLENEKVADLKSEYVNGECLPFIGASRTHDRLCVRLAESINLQLAGSDCRLFRPTVKAHVRGPGDERFYYPDLQIACGEQLERPDYLDCPRVIVEVVSPTSERRDREEKAPAYRTIEALQELVLIDCDNPRIEVWRRDSGWKTVQPTGEAPIELVSIGVALSTARLYEGLS